MKRKEMSRGNSHLSSFDNKIDSSLSLGDRSRLLFFLLLLFCSAQDQNQGLVHARKAFTTELHPQPLVFETGSRYIAQIGLELKILLPLPPECWDYKYEPPHPM
jgi:hypothetical protein